MFLSLPSYRLLQAPLPCTSEDVPRPTDNASSSLWPPPSSVSLHVVGRHKVSQDTRLAAPARQLVCFLVLLCACESSPGAWVTAPRRWNERGGHLSSQPLPISSQSGLQGWPNGDKRLLCHPGLQGLLSTRGKRVTLNKGLLLPPWARRCLIEPSPPPPDLIKGSLLMLPSRPPSIFGHR